jgi:3-hydroxybutyryl-CoA dehydrogenase
MNRRDRNMNAEEVKQVAVIGTGIMGEGIVQSFAIAGFSVKAVDQDAAILSGAVKQIEANLQLFSEVGILGQEKIPSVLSRIETFLPGNLSEATEGCGLVVECIPEVMRMKGELFARLDSCPEETILASNTSAFTISAITEGMKTPHRVVGIHYFNPAHIMPLVEIHRGKNTSDEVVDIAKRLMLKTGKLPILIRKEIPGFLVNRIQAAMGREANYLVELGVVTPEDLDIAARTSYGFRLACTGPLEQQDLSGLDTLARAMQQLYKTLNNSTEPAAQILQKVKDGEIGVKAGRGWYSYEGRTRAQILRDRDKKLLEQLILFNKREGIKL